MTPYLKYIPLPEVHPYSGTDKGYSFKDFLDAFELKYPKESWADSELLHCSGPGRKGQKLIRGVTKHERKGGYKALVENMKRECGAEQCTSKVVALGN